MTQTAFVAYSSRLKAISDTVLRGVRKANASSKDIYFEPWEFNDISGNPLVSPILEKINDSRFVVADITILNPNVVYEIGYTIGKNKRTFLIRHAKTPGHKELAQEVGIFDTLGYESYDDEEDLSRKLLSYIDTKPIPYQVDLDRKAPVYVVETPTKGEFSTLMISRLKKARYKYRSFNPEEDIRLSAGDAIRQVACSAGVMTLLLDGDDDMALIHNTRALFAIGLAHGMSKPSLLLAPKGYLAPSDVRDVAKYFEHPDDIPKHIGELSLEITEYLQGDDPLPLGPRTLLQSINMGDPTAENEMSTLSTYYLETDEFHRALRGDVNLVVGRKGAGKTALFIQVRDYIRKDRRNIVVDLRPEGYQLLKLKEKILHHLTPGSREHLITGFWEYLLLLEVAHKLLEKDRQTHVYNHEIQDVYKKLHDTYRSGDFESEGDFSERLHVLSHRLLQRYAELDSTDDGPVSLSSKQVSEILYTHDLRSLKSTINNYLDKKHSVWILFDNLDKNWNTDGVDSIDTLVLRCLIDAGRKLERDMRKRSHLFRCIVFVRNDVYQELMKHSSDYGKEMRAVLDWTDPDLLREMLRLRLVTAFGKNGRGKSFEQIWPVVCVSHYKGEDTSNYMIERSLMRPRNLLKLFSHCRGYAINLNHAKITEEDLRKGLRTYSQDLIIEVDRELGDVFPKARDILYHFIDAPPEFSLRELRQWLANTGAASTEIEEVIRFLLYYGVIGIQDSSGSRFIFDVNYDLRMLQIRVSRAGDDARLVINPAFWPALGIQES